MLQLVAAKQSARQQHSSCLLLKITVATQQEFLLDTGGEVYLLDEEPPKVAQGPANLKIVAPSGAALEAEILLIFACKGSADIAIRYDGIVHILFCGQPGKHPVNE